MAGVCAAPGSSASVNWVTIRCASRPASGIASLAWASSGARSAVVIATLASPSPM